jgi:hypothetical protein
MLYSLNQYHNLHFDYYIKIALGDMLGTQSSGFFCWRKRIPVKLKSPAKGG